MALSSELLCEKPQTDVKTVPIFNAANTSYAAQITVIRSISSSTDCRGIEHRSPPLLLFVSDCDHGSRLPFPSRTRGVRVQH